MQENIKGNLSYCFPVFLLPLANLITAAVTGLLCLSHIPLQAPCSLSCLRRRFSFWARWQRNCSIATFCFSVWAGAVAWRTDRICIPLIAHVLLNATAGAAEIARVSVLVSIDVLADGVLLWKAKDAVDVIERKQEAHKP